MIIDWTDNKYFAGFRAFINTTSGGAFVQIPISVRGAVDVVHEVRVIEFIHWEYASNVINADTSIKFINKQTNYAVVKYARWNHIAQYDNIKNVIQYSNIPRFSKVTSTGRIINYQDTSKIDRHSRDINVVRLDPITKVVNT